MASVGDPNEMAEEMLVEEFVVGDPGQAQNGKSMTKNRNPKTEGQKDFTLEGISCGSEGKLQVISRTARYELIETKQFILLNSPWLLLRSLNANKPATG